MAVLQEKTTARVKKGVAYYEGESFTLSNIDKVKIIDLSRYTGYTYSRSDNDLIISHYGTCITIKDYFGANGTVASTVKTLRIYDNGQKKGYKDYNLTTSGLLNHIDSGVENFAIKKGVITGTAFADTISAEDFNKPTGKKKDMGVTIKTGFGNDNITGSNYKDTFNITGSGTKTINIGADDGDDTIKGINTNGVSLNLNISNTVSKYERTGNDLKITANGEETSTTTTIKDYFKNTTTAPYIRINGNSLLGNLNDTELVNVDKSTQTKDQTIKGTFLDDKITGSNKADKITTGYGKDIITGGLGNDKITIDGLGSKYIVMNPDDGVDTVDTKVNDYIYLQFKGAGITNDSTAKANLTYEKSGKNDLKITNTTIKSAEIAPKGYISNTGIDTDKLSFYYSCGSGSYYTQITEDTGLYSYETDGETRYTTEKNATVKLNTTKLIQSRNSSTGIVDSVGYITDSSNYSASTDYYTVTSLSDENITNLYAYKSKTYSGVYEYVYSTNNNVAIKYSDLWLKKPYSDSSYYVFTTTKENDDCIAVSSLDKIYHWYDEVRLEKPSDTYEEITSDKFNSIYYVDKNHQYVVDIDNNNTTPIYKEFDISSSYYLKRPNAPYSTANYKGMAVSTALDETSYTKIEKIYITADDEGNYTYSTVKPKGFKEETDSTSVIIKDYLTKEQSVLITNSDNTSSTRWLSSILYDIGVNIGNADSKKAQTLTGSRLNDNIYGGSGKDKITTGNGNDTITGRKGNDTITVDGYGSKYVVMNSGDGVDTLNIKNTSASTYLQFKGADITDGASAITNLKYEKSGKNDLKITYTEGVKEFNNYTGLYFYDKYGSNELILFNENNMYSESSDYFTELSSTGLYSYENEDGKTSYSTNKTETIALNTVYFEMNGWSYKDGVGYLTTTPHEDTGYSATALSGVQKVYAYKNTISPSYTPNGKPVTEIIYTIDSNVTPTKYSDLWLKPQNDGYSDYYYVIVTSKETDDCIRVSDQEALYTYDLLPSYYGDGRIYLDDNGGLPLFITSDKYDSVYYFDHDHSYITDIDNDSTNGLYKEYTVSDSYFLARNGEGEEVEYLQQGDATTKSITSSDYTQINTLYSSKDSDGNTVYSTVKDSSKKNVDTSIILKDYLTKEQNVYIAKSNSNSSIVDVDSILNYTGLNVGNANSKKAQTLTGSRLNDNIYGGSGKDKITTGAGNDTIIAGKGNDTITINGNGNKTVNIVNADGNDTIIFTDNNKKTAYDYTTNKMLYLNFDDDAELSYSMKGKDLVINRSYVDGTKTASAATTLKDYFNTAYKKDIVKNIYINGTLFNSNNYFDGSTIDKSSGKKSQKINGNMFNNTIIGGSANDTINGCGGSDTLDGKNGSDTYVVNYKSGSKYYYSDKIVISDTGTGAKDIDTLKLDVKKKDMVLLFNVNKITDTNAYTENDIVVGSGDSAIHYSYDKQLMIFADFELIEGVTPDSESNKLTSDSGIIADGLEKITTSDKKTITLTNIKTIAQDVANWLSTANNGAGYDSSAEACTSGNSIDLINIFAKYNPDNAVIKEYMNAG